MFILIVSSLFCSIYPLHLFNSHIAKFTSYFTDLYSCFLYNIIDVHHNSLLDRRIWVNCCCFFTSFFFLTLCWYKIKRKKTNNIYIEGIEMRCGVSQEWMNEKEWKRKNVNNKIKCKTRNLCDGKEVWDKRKRMNRKHIKKKMKENK